MLLTSPYCARSSASLLARSASRSSSAIHSPVQRSEMTYNEEGGADERMPRKGRPVKKTGKASRQSKQSGNASSPSTPQERLMNCLQQLTGWLEKRGTELHSALSHYEVQPRVVSWADLVLCLKTLQAPVTPADLDLLQPVLDPEGTGLITVATLHSSLSEKLMQMPAVNAAASLQACEKCGLRQPDPPAEKDPNYVQLHMILAPFAHMPSHPGHTHMIVTDSTTVHSLQEMLQDRLSGTASAIAVFTDASLQPSSLVAPRKRLVEMGVAGGTRATPTQAQLYYDYVPLVVDCPLLMADHYFPTIPLTTRGSR